MTVSTTEMGKKDKKKQGRGQEKTQQKSEAKAAKRTKKEAASKGEDDVEALIAEFVAKDKKQASVHVETGCPQPAVRSSFSFTASPVRDELFLFGGEYFNGKQTLLNNDLYAYTFKRGGEWSLIKAPNAPPPRCSHQTVAVPQAGGQLWVFGGEFASPTQSQFYHYNDLWSLSLNNMQWTRHDAPGRPSPRSGHRMIAWKKLLIVFGGFHEVHDTFKYFNDVHAFSLETYQWVKLDISGTAPAPRSGCQMTVNKQGKIVVYGGYSKSKVKKDVEKGIVHTDMFFLAPQEKPESADGDDSAKNPVKWKWVQVRQSGDKPTPRSGFSLLPYSPAPSGGFSRALLYGGVCDDEEDEETLKSVFYNDMYTVDLENGKWYELYLKGEKAADGEPKKSRRRRKSAGDKKDDADDAGGDEEDAEEEEEEEQEMDEDEDQTIKKPKIEEEAKENESKQIFDDGIFTVSIGAADENDADGASSSAAAASAQKRIAQSASAFVPEERMNAQVALKNNVAYLYGGMKEDGDKTLTLRDFYSLDLSKLDTWRTISRDERETKEWAEMSESSDDEEEEEEEEGAAGGDSEEDEEDEFDDFWEDNRARFIDLATKELEKSGQTDVTKKMIKNRAFQLAKEEFTNQ